MRRFAQAQRDSLIDFEIERRQACTSVRSTSRSAPPAPTCPAGYPLTASAHMTIVTAKVAGVPRVAACTPPIRGEIPAATVAAMHLAGADEIYLLGGVQAVVALALGTETIDRVNIIAGPGNAYVAEAKRQLFGEVGIDLFAGPDRDPGDRRRRRRPVRGGRRPAQPGRARPRLAGGARHDERGRGRAGDGLHRRASCRACPPATSPGRRGATTARCSSSTTSTRRIAVADTFASEHVEMLTSEPRAALDEMHDYGALFLGEGTCVSYGDKVIGTNHVLPTRGAARYTGGLWVGKYLRPSPTRRSPTGRRAPRSGELCGRAARVELFEGHARSGDVRAWQVRRLRPPWAPMRPSPRW